MRLFPRFPKSKTAVLLGKIDALSGQLRTLSKQVDELIDAHNEYMEKTEKKSGFLENELRTKTVFVERLLERTLMNGHDKEHANGKNGDIIDLNTLDAATQTYVRNKLKANPSKPRLP